MRNLKIMTLMLAALMAMPMAAQTRKKVTTARRPATTAKKPAQSATVGKPKLVDLGLPSGTKWADRNLGATSVTSFGSYYAYGETTSKQTFSDTNYKGDITFPTIAGTGNDAATKKYGKGWSVPTQKQFQELLDNCEKSNAIVNGVFVIKLTGSNGNSIYLPYPPNKTIMKAKDAANTKQLNEYWYNSTLYSSSSYQNLKFAAQQRGMNVKDGIVAYFTADKTFILLMGSYCKDNKSSLSANEVVPIIQDGVNQAGMFGMPIRPVFTPTQGEASGNEENDGTLELPD